METRTIDPEIWQEAERLTKENIEWRRFRLFWLINCLIAAIGLGAAIHFEILPPLHSLIFDFLNKHVCDDGDRVIIFILLLSIAAIFIGVPTMLLSENLFPVRAVPKQKIESVYENLIEEQTNSMEEPENEKDSYC